MNILISICVRGGSKGVPGKNIKKIAGMPLLAYSIKNAQKFKSHSDHNISIALSTDSEAIRKVAAEYGLQTDYVRPDFLATDEAGKLDAMKDILLYEEKKKQIRFDYLLDLDATAPLRTVDDLSKALHQLQTNDEALNLFSVSPAHKNPYFNMVEERSDGFVSLCKPLNNNVLSRQSAPKVFDMNASFYYFKRVCFDQQDFYTINNKSIAYVMQNICFDIDTQLDFDIMEYLIEHQKVELDI